MSQGHYQLITSHYHKVNPSIATRQSINTKNQYTSTILRLLITSYYFWGYKRALMCDKLPELPTTPLSQVNDEQLFELIA